MNVIKLMYDLLLSGEGHGVVGSRNSMKSNSYRSRFGEGSMGGINRAAPAQDVSYEKVLDEVKAMWKEEQSVDEDCWDGYKQVGMKDKSGKQVPNCVPVDEVYQGPHHGDPQKLAKAPKSTMQGSEAATFSELVQDTINVHGVKYAFDYYVKKHGLPPRQFKIFAGL